MYEYKGKGQGQGVTIDTVLDDVNRLTLGESKARPSRARGSNDPMPNEDEPMQENHVIQRKTKSF